MNWDLKLELWEREEYNNNIRPVVSDIAQKMDSMIGLPPVLGYNLIWIINDPYYGMQIYKPLSEEYYKLGLTVGHLTYGKMAYQFSHLLSMIYTDPRQTNWFSQVIGHMASFWFLDWLGEKWENDYSSGDYSEIYTDFINLKNEKVKTAYQNVDIMLNLASDEWVKEEVDRLENNVNNISVPPVIFDQLALEILPYFKDENSWKLLHYIGLGTRRPIEDSSDLRFRPRSKPDFENLSKIVPSELQILVNRIRVKFFK